MTLAGDSDVLEDIAGQLTEAEIFNRFLSGKVPYHTHYMEVVKDDLFRSLDGLSSGTAAIPLYSTVTGEQLGEYAAGAAYWWQNTRATVLFEAAARRMMEDGYTHFVELGPHPVLAPSLIEVAGTQQAEPKTEIVVLPTQRRDDDDSRTLMSCVGALYCHGHELDWSARCSRAGARLLKLPSYPWQSKRFWNETQEAAEELHYRPVHPLLGQPVNAVHPTWEVELSTAAIPFLNDHQVQGSVLVPGAVFVEIALAAAKETYGSTDYCVDDLVLHRAVILDETCDPLLRTTLNPDTGALEFAAFTATADGELGWAITATAELNTLPRPARRDELFDGSESARTLSGHDFYAHTRAIGFGYGPAFQTVGGITAGDGWAEAELAIPDELAGELARHRFHPALIDGAFQTLFGARLLGNDTDEQTYLPTRIRRSAVYHRPEANMVARVRVVSATREEIESDIILSNQAGQPLAASTVSWCVHCPVRRVCRWSGSTRGSTKSSGSGCPRATTMSSQRRPARQTRPGWFWRTPPVSAQRSPNNCDATATAPNWWCTNPSMHSPRSTVATRSTRADLSSCATCSSRTWSGAASPASSIVGHSTWTETAWPITR